MSTEKSAALRGKFTLDSFTIEPEYRELLLELAKELSEQRGEFTSKAALIREGCYLILAKYGKIVLEDDPPQEVKSDGVESPASAG